MYPNSNIWRHAQPVACQKPYSTSNTLPTSHVTLALPMLMCLDRTMVVPHEVTSSLENYTDSIHETYELCPSDATALATCACEKNQNSLLVSQAVDSIVKYDCASHTGDISSAQAMFAAYCAMNQGTSSFPTASSPPGDSKLISSFKTQPPFILICRHTDLNK